MFTVNIFNKKEQKFLTYEHVHKIIYEDVVSENILTEDNIFSHKFQLGYDLHIFSQTGNFTVSYELIGVIEIIKE